MQHLHDEQFLELNKLILQKYENDFSISEFDIKTYESFSKSYIETPQVRAEIYTQAQQLKMEYFSELITDSFAAKLPSIDASFYHENMFKIVLGQVIFWSSSNVMINNETVTNDFEFRKKLSDFFTDEGIRDNRLTTTFTIQYKQNGEWKETKYPEGMKITRFFVSLFSNLQIKNRDNEKMIGKMRLDPNDYQDIYLSTYLPVFIRSGIIGSSCLSPDGSNSHGSFINSGYPNLAVVHDADFNNRAWLALDNGAKRFAIAHCYPHENHYLQIATRNYMVSKGYTEVNGSYFSFNEYIDMSSTKGLEIEHDGHLRENKDSEHEYGDSIFKVQNYNAYKCVCDYYSCDNCDRRSMDPNFIYENGYCYECYEEQNEHIYCERCGEYIHVEDSYYDEETSESYCSGCYDDILKEREVEKLGELEGEEDSLREYVKNHFNLEIPYGVDSYFIDGYKDYITNLITKNEFEVKLDYTFYVNKGIEYEIAMAYLDACEYKWNSGHKPSEFKASFGDFGKSVEISAYNKSLNYRIRRARHNVLHQDYLLYFNSFLLGILYKN